MSTPRRVSSSVLCSALLLGPWSAAAEVAAAEVEVTAQGVAVEASDDDSVALKLATDADPDAEASDEPQVDPAVERMQKQITKLQAESQLRTQQLEAELAALVAENQRLKQAFQLAQQKQQSELQPLQLEKARIDAEAGLNQSRLTAENAPLDAELAGMQKQQQLRDARLANELAQLNIKTQTLQAEQGLLAAQRQAELAEGQHEQQRLSMEMELLSLRFRADRLEDEAEQTQASADLNRINTNLQRRSADEQVHNLVEDDLVYRENPFEDGVLYISDRRIALNGPIITGTADYVCDRIDFFNNENPDKPIFIMIDNCPGGSVMQGYRIVKSIEASEAPVHVVVKSFAASMAAVITTLAEHSYAYPNAIILHHQMSAGAIGNMTDIEEQLETLLEWEARLAVPVAEKMGISLEEFKDQMYENKTSGDWDEFADRAVELKWVNTLVNEVREEGVRQRPTGRAPRPWYFGLFAQDQHGKTYVNLPPLEPMDAYMMYNPNHFFRVDGR